MYKLEDYETKMIHDGKRNNRYVKIVCERCSNEHWVRWSAVQRGYGRFCSKECFHDYERETSERSYIGKENGKPYFIKNLNRWNVYWFNKNGKRHNMSYARWWWQMNKGPIPKGYRASFKDGDSSNIDPDNIILISPEEFGKQMSERLQGHEVSLETREKISKAHTGTLNWNGFVGKPEYPGLSKRQKLYVKNRDDFTCKACGVDLHNHRKSCIVHHIDGDKTNQNLDNLITVCKKCHAKIHSKMNVSDEILAFRSALQK